MVRHNPLVQRMVHCCATIAGILLIGTLGYVLIERWSTQESFYMSVITLSTVGYGETRELSPEGRWFTAGLIFISIAGLSCFTASLTSLFVEGDLSGEFRRKKAKKMAASLKNHTIVCGTGIMAKTILDELTRKRVAVVVVDDSESELEIIRHRYPTVPVIEASAVDEMALFDAGVLNAQSIVAALPSDFDNLLIAMTCKDLGTDIQVVARTDDLRIAGRMLKVGVEHVICPYQLSGEHAANMITNSSKTASSVNGPSLGIQTDELSGV
jgi:voltage-gated potassium channel